MLVLGLLLVGLACLVLGILFASSPWLIGSLVAAVVAGITLYRQRSQIGGWAPDPGEPAPTADAGQASAGGAVARAVDPGTGSFADGSGRRRGTPVPPKLRVWVIDGRPAYHLGQCPELNAVPAGTVPERVALDQAHEDGFLPCRTCEPTAERIAAGSSIELGSAPVGRERSRSTDEVWVIDGRPRYHRTGCLLLAGQPAEPVPRAQAVEDGFLPCSMCEPDADP